MLIKIGETQWIKAKKINAVQLCKKTGETWGIRVYAGACIFDHAEGMFEELKAYMAKHIAFVYTHDIHGDKIAESLKDIAVYSLIGLYMVETSRTKEEMMQAHSDCVAASCRYQRDSMEEQLAASLKAATSEPSGINMED